MIPLFRTRIHAGTIAAPRREAQIMLRRLPTNVLICPINAPPQIAPMLATTVTTVVFPTERPVVVEGTWDTDPEIHET